MAPDSVVPVPADIPVERLRIIKQYGPEMIRVEGDYGRLYYDALDAGPRQGVEFVNSDMPLRVASQQTIALEILERFAPDVSDAFVLPASNGGHASACLKTLRELDAVGLLPSVPKLCFVQSAACAPIADAFESGADAVSPTEPGETLAYSIAPAQRHPRTRAARATNGAVTAMTDEEIVAAKARLADRAGLCVEVASATSLAGARKLVSEGVLDRFDDVVLVATGTGYKQTTGMAEPDDRSPAIPLADLNAELAAGVDDGGPA